MTPGLWEVAIVGVCCGASFVCAALLWYLHVRPDLVLDLLTDDRNGQEHHPRLIAGLRWALSVMVLGLGFMTGAAMAFLTATQVRS